MRNFSASESVWPAIQRTYDYLFRPFQWRCYLKVAAVSVVSEGIVVSLPIVFPNSLTSKLETIASENLFDPWHIALAIWAMLVVVVLLCISLYWITHLRFVFFDCLLRKTKDIRRKWSNYEISAERLCKANLLVWLVDIGMFLLLAIVLVIAAFTVFNVRSSSGKLDPGVLLMMLFPSLALACCVLLIATIFEVVLHDFILPHMAIEHCSFGEAWKIVKQHISKDKETFVSYFIVRTVLPLIASAVLGIVAFGMRWFFSLLLALSVAECEELIGSTTRIGNNLLLAIDGGFILVGLSLWILICICLAAPVAIWIRYYAILFYGQRYSALKN